MSINSYPDMISSGLMLAPLTPRHWKKTALKFLADYQNGYPFKPEDWKEDGLPIIRIAQLTGESEPNYFSGDLDHRVRVSNGDLLFSWSATIDSFIWNRGSAWLNQHIFKVTPSIDADKSYLFYLIKHVAPKLADVDAHGSTMRHIKKESLGERIFVPDVAEQKNIALFLDRETAKIDALITEQEKLIKLLREKRQAFISHAVTKGFDLSVKMKDSGFEWLGEVPDHWTVCPVKRYTELITDGAHISPETEGGVYDFVSTKDLSDGEICFDGALKTSASSFEFLSKNGCQPLVGDVLFSKDGTIGRTVVVTDGHAFVVASSLIIIRPDKRKLHPEFLNYLCQSDFVQQQVERFVKGAGLPRLSIHNLLKVYGCFPGIEEQIFIVNCLTKELKSLKDLEIEAEKAMGLLLERRSTLISAAVTGQIDVRDIAKNTEAT